MLTAIATLGDMVGDAGKDAAKKAGHGVGLTNGIRNKGVIAHVTVIPVPSACADRRRYLGREKDQPRDPGSGSRG